MSQFQLTLPADTMANRVLGRWMDRNVQRSLAQAKAANDPDLITRDGSVQEVKTKLFKNGRQLGMVIWANLRTKKYAQVEVDFGHPGKGFSDRLTGRVVTGFFDDFER